MKLEKKKIIVLIILVVVAIISFITYTIKRKNIGKKIFVSEAQRLIRLANDQVNSDDEYSYFCYDNGGLDEHLINGQTKLNYFLKYKDGTLEEFLIASDKYNVYFKDIKGINNTDFISSYTRLNADNGYEKIECEGGLGRNIKTGEISEKRKITVSSDNIVVKDSSKIVYEGQKAEFNIVVTKGLDENSISVKCSNDQYAYVDLKKEKMIIETVTNDSECKIYSSSNTYTINYDTSGSSTIIEQGEKKYDATYIITSEIPVREGYTFLGWSTEKNSEKVDYTAGKTYSENKSLSLYAVWQLNNYNVSVSVIGATVENKTKTVKYGSSVSFTLNIKTGYAFGGEVIKNCDGAYIKGTNENTRELVIDKVSGNMNCSIQIGSSDLASRIKINATTNQLDLNDNNSGLFNLSNTYVFKGNVSNNYVSFAGMIWRVLRVNSNNTIRIISESPINITNVSFNPNYNDYKYFYYSNSNVAGGIKKGLEEWYAINLNKYDSKIAKTEYCEAARTKYSNTTANLTKMKYYADYIPQLSCSIDENKKSGLTAKIGLPSYDELIYAGGTIESSKSYFLNNGSPIVTMSPSGFNNNIATVWYMLSNGKISEMYVNSSVKPRVVISLNSQLIASGQGTKNNPYKIE